MKKAVSFVLVFMMMMVFGMSSVFAAASYDAVTQFDTAKADGSNVPWQYLYSTDQGSTFKVIEKYTDWGNNAGGAWNPDIKDCWAGVGNNQDAKVKGNIEFNSSDGNAQIGALAFVAPKDGDYTINAFKVTSPWGQTPDKFYVYNGTTKLYEGTIPADGSALDVAAVAVALKAGDKVIFYATNSSKFTSSYAKIVVAEAGAADTNPPTGDTTPVILLTALLILSGAGIIFSRKLKTQK